MGGFSSFFGGGGGGAVSGTFFHDMLDFCLLLQNLVGAVEGEVLGFIFCGLWFFFFFFGLGRGVVSRF